MRSRKGRGQKYAKRICRVFPGKRWWRPSSCDVSPPPKYSCSVTTEASFLPSCKLTRQRAGTAKVGHCVVAPQSPGHTLWPSVSASMPNPLERSWTRVERCSVVSPPRGVVHENEHSSGEDEEPRQTSDLVAKLCKRALNPRAPSPVVAVRASAR
jgi:hypothetical protein